MRKISSLFMQMNRETEKQKKNPPSSLLWRGGLWGLGLCLSVYAFNVITFYSDIWSLSTLWIYFVIACGSIPPTIVFLLEPHNPFQGDWMMPRRIDTYTLDERRALTFLKNSPKIKKIIIQTGILVFLSVFLTPFTRLLLQGPLPPSQITSEKMAMLIGPLIFQLLFSLLAHSFVTNRYLLKHWDEIVAVDIEPWPLNKPYTRGSLKLRKDEEVRGAFLREVFSRPIGRFGWREFGMYFSAASGFFALVIGISGGGTRFQLICAVLAPALFLISYLFWKRKGPDQK